MSIYNTLVTTLRCPHCCSEVEVRIDFRFGLRDQFEYRLGDRITWEGAGVRTPVHRPTNGEFDGEGYTECCECSRSFWTCIRVRDDVLDAVEVDWDREEYSR